MNPEKVETLAKCAKFNLPFKKVYRIGTNGLYRLTEYVRTNWGPSRETVESVVGNHLGGSLARDMIVGRNWFPCAWCGIEGTNIICGVCGMEVCKALSKGDWFVCCCGASGPITTSPGITQIGIYQTSNERPALGAAGNKSLVGKSRRLIGSGS